MIAFLALLSPPSWPKVSFLHSVQHRTWKRPQAPNLIGAKKQKSPSRGAEARLLRNRPPRSANLQQADLIDQAVGGHDVAVARDIDVAHDVAAAWDHPGLELLGRRIETHHRVGLGVRLVVVDRALGEGDAVGLRLRPARR